MFIAAAIVLIGAGMLMELWAVLAAPLGYQDEKGFHHGAKRSGADDSRSSLNPS